MHTADHKIVEVLSLVQGIVLALILCGIVAMEYGWLEMFMRYKGMTQSHLIECKC